MKHKLLSRLIGEVASHALLCDSMDSSLHQAPLTMGFSRQEYWSGLPFRVALKWEGGETKSLHNLYHCLQQWLKD